MEAIQKAAEDGRNLEPGNVVYTGLTKREHFTGLALQGVLANDVLLNLISAKHEGVDVCVIAAATALRAADTLLKQLDEINTAESAGRESSTEPPTEQSG